MHSNLRTSRPYSSLRLSISPDSENLGHIHWLLLLPYPLLIQKEFSEEMNGASMCRTIKIDYGYYHTVISQIMNPMFSFTKLRQFFMSTILDNSNGSISTAPAHMQADLPRTCC